MFWLLLLLLKSRTIFLRIRNRVTWCGISWSIIVLCYISIVPTIIDRYGILIHTTLQFSEDDDGCLVLCVFVRMGPGCGIKSKCTICHVNFPPPPPLSPLFFPFVEWVSKIFRLLLQCLLPLFDRFFFRGDVCRKKKTNRLRVSTCKKNDDDDDDDDRSLLKTVITWQWDKNLFFFYIFHS